MSIRALSTAALGMSAQKRSVDNIANNVANVNTTGFKRSNLAFQDMFYETIPTSRRGNTMLNGRSDSSSLQIGNGSKPVTTVRNFTQGPLSETGNPLNLAVNGDGFFRLELPDRTEVYTRDGNFSLDSNGRIVNPSGLVLADNIEIPENTTTLKISKEGLVSVRIGNNERMVDIGEIELVKFVNPGGLNAMGDNLFAATEASGSPIFGRPGIDSFGTLEQGYLESSNVDIVMEMVGLIEAQRAFEINSKMVQTAEEMLSLSNNLKR